MIYFLLEFPKLSLHDIMLLILSCYNIALSPAHSPLVLLLILIPHSLPLHFLSYLYSAPSSPSSAPPPPPMPSPPPPSLSPSHLSCIILWGFRKIFLYVYHLNTNLKWRKEQSFFLQ